jgi:hypothetical protein
MSSQIQPAANSASGQSFAVYRENVGDPPAYLRYEKLKNGFFREVKKGLTGMDPSFRSYNDNLKAAALRTKSGEQGSIEVSDSGKLLQNFTVEYANAQLIGTELFPVVPTPEEGSTYLELIREEQYQAKRRPGGGGTRVEADEVDGYRYIRVPFTCESDSREGYVGKDKVISDSTPINHMFNLRESVDWQIALGREIFIRDLVTDTANYATSNQLALTSGIRWDDNGGDPGADILNAVGKIWRGTGSSRLVAWTSYEVWTVLRRAPSMLRLLPAQNQGFMSAMQFLDIMGLDGLLVSEARENTANIAKTPVFSRIWGNNFGICRVSTTPTLKNASFGFTMRWTPSALPQGMETNLWFDPKRGDFGSFGYKVALKEKPIITAADTGYLFTTPIN